MLVAVCVTAAFLDTTAIMEYVSRYQVVTTRLLTNLDKFPVNVDFTAPAATNINVQQELISHI